MTDTAAPSAEPLRDLPSGRFSGRETFQQLVRDAIATAARDGWQEIFISDANFHDWPLGERAVVNKHVVRNALIPVITVIGLQVGVLFTGAILTETIFSWPGVGKWLIEAISRRDYPVLQGGMLLLGAVVMTVNLLVDVTYGIINPRIRHQK